MIQLFKFCLNYDPIYLASLTIAGLVLVFFLFEVVRGLFRG